MVKTEMKIPDQGEIVLVATPVPMISLGFNSKEPSNCSFLIHLTVEQAKELSANLNNIINLCRNT